jgi:glycosyltransferase involved in cell wall biosynthesis
MRILLTLPRPLFPADTGGKIRTLQIFERLARRHEIHALSFADPQLEAEPIARMRALFAGYTPVAWRETRTFSPAFYAGFVRSRFSRFPYFLGKYRRPEYRAAVENLLARGGFDLLLCDFLHSAVALLESPFRPRIVFEHNVEYVIRRRHAECETNPATHWLLRAEWEKARAAEADVCRAFDHVVAVSEEDRETLKREFGIAHVSAIPTGVDLDYFHPGGGTTLPGNIVFVGSMDWYPNEEGILWFLEQVYPEIRRAVPSASVTLVGRNPSDRIRALAGRQPAVELTGTVPDVRPYLERAAAVLVPLRIGGGTRIKIFEAMAMEKAIVSTGIGAEGLPVSAGRDILIADEPLAFARSVVSLLEDAGLRERIAGAARERVLRDHSWEQVADRMAEILESTVRAASARTNRRTDDRAAVLSG